MIWILALLLLPIAYLLQNCLHEASHLAVAWLTQGSKPLAFKPWPHKYKDRFYFARCKFGPAKINLISKKWIYIAPFIIAVTWGLVTLSLSAIFTKVFLVFTFTAVIDALWFWRGYYWGSKKCDGKRYRKYKEK